jgi:CDP-paratose 2-epimerase
MSVEPRRLAVVFGGAGFVGTNLTHKLLERGRNVRIFDNLSSHGSAENLDWLVESHKSRIEVAIGDIRDRSAVADAVREATEVYHLAAQSAVGNAVIDPIVDFEINVRGTLNVLESVRALRNPPPLLYTSTHKVYGALPEITVVASGDRYRPVERGLERSGINESHALEFYSPYGCSKGAAEQYVLDYTRSFGLRTIVFRMSTIYGPHQRGTEGRGWISYFMSEALKQRPITIYGSGRQVRDVLYVDDLIEAMLLAMAQIELLAGQAFNVGGGPENTLSLFELLRWIERFSGRRPEVSFEGWRIGDQRYYVSDIAKISEDTGWQPATGVGEGLSAIWHWLSGFAPMLLPLPQSELTTDRRKSRDRVS